MDGMVYYPIFFSDSDPDSCILFVHYFLFS